MDFSQFDQDGNNEIDLTVFLHSGYGGELPTVDCNTGALNTERIAAHASASTGMWQWQSSTSDFKLGAYSVASAFRSGCGAKIARLGVLVHEMIHPFGIPDLYDADGAYDPSSRFLGGLDRYCIMANPLGQGMSQARPGHLSAWPKVDLG